MATRPSVIGAPTTFNTSGANTSSASHAVVAGTTILVVTIRAQGQSFGALITSVTFGAAPLTRAANAPDDMSVWYLLLPSISTATIVITSNGQATVIQAGAHNMQGNHPSAPFGASTAQNAAGVHSGFSMTVTATGADDLLIGAIGLNAGLPDPYFTPGTGVTETYDIYNAGVGQHGGGGTMAGTGGSILWAWTFGAPTGGGGYQTIAILMPPDPGVILVPNAAVASFSVGSPAIASVVPARIAVGIESGATQRVEVAAI
jgi:hypothetical protein